MTKAPELLPCPFCGGEAIYHPDHTTECVDSIYCEACDAQVSDFNLSGGQGACRELWNTRTDHALALVAAAQDGSRPVQIDRDQLGRFVREAWVRWAKTHQNPKPSWLVDYDELREPDKEADRQIGEAVARWTLIYDAAQFARTPDDATAALKARDQRIRNEALREVVGRLQNYAAYLSREGSRVTAETMKAAELVIKDLITEGQSDG